MQKVTEIITSRQNPLISLAAGLAERKVRRREGLFRFDGKKLFREALLARLPLTAVLLREGSASEIMDFVSDLALPDGVRAVLLPDTLFDRISEEKSPEGVICISKTLDKIHKIVTIDKSAPICEAIPAGKTLLLESVRDPGNLGTIIRSASAFGVKNLVLSSDCADLYNPRTIRAAMGTLFSQSVYVAEDLVAVIEALRTRGRVFAAALCADAARLGEVCFGENDAALVGNEGHGLSDAALTACSDTLYIPMECGVESLNAGVAASVILWELYRGQ
jgi:TrmH family RNA methyltransferase